MPEYYARLVEGQIELAKFLDSDAPVEVYHIRRRVNGKLACDCPAARFRGACKHTQMAQVRALTGRLR